MKIFCVESDDTVTLTLFKEKVFKDCQRKVDHTFENFKDSMVTYVIQKVSVDLILYTNNIGCLNGRFR